MFRIHVTTTAVASEAKPWARSNARRMLLAGETYAGTDFTLCDRPGEADVVLFVDSSEPYLGDVLRSPLYREYRHRSFVFNHNDGAVPVVPGIYPDLAGPVRRPDLHLGGFYLRCFENELLVERDERWAPDYLFSFVGNSRNAPAVRRRVLALTHVRALLLDSSSKLQDNDPGYVDSLRRSRFVVCPRGLGPTSWRFYETMMASRAPVIVSDAWVPAREIEWERFSLRVAERDIESIPALCEANADRAREMGEIARQQWETHCSLSRAFGWTGRRLLELRDAVGGGRPGRAAFVRELAARRLLGRALRWKLRVTFDPRARARLRAKR